MAISAFSLDKACEILREIIPELQPGILHFDEEIPIRPGWIVAVSMLENNGCESVFTDIQDITKEQFQLFNDRCSNFAIPIREDMGQGITRIGWF